MRVARAPLGLVALVVAMGLTDAGRADAGRGGLIKPERTTFRHGARTPRPTTGNRPNIQVNSRAFGEGVFSRVYLSQDGRHVIKVLRSMLDGVVPISEERRAELARRTVAASERLRKSGFPIPRSFIPHGRQGLIVQELAVGKSMDELWAFSPLNSPLFEIRAKLAASRMILRAMRAAKKLGATSWHVDRNIYNFRFDEKGRITAWVDPVIPLSADEARSIFKP